MSTEIFMRTAHFEDTSSLRHIWQTAFGDGSAEIDAFFKHWPERELTIVADCDGKPVSAGYLLPVGEYFGKPCAMIYSVTTLPEYRGRGLAAQVTRRLILLARDAGFSVIIVRPAEDTLFDYYSRATELYTGFFVREYTIPHSEIKPGDGFLAALTASDYMKLRAGFLDAAAHVEQSLRVWEYQSVLCSMCGGGFFGLPDMSGCAVIERADSETVLIKELLVSAENEKTALSAIAAAFDAREYTVRTPVSPGRDNKNVRRFGMLTATLGFPKITGTEYFGMAFD